MEGVYAQETFVVVVTINEESSSWPVAEVEGTMEYTCEQGRASQVWSPLSVGTIGGRTWLTSGH